MRRVPGVAVEAQNYLAEFSVREFFGQRRVIHDVDKQTRGVDTFFVLAGTNGAQLLVMPMSMCASS